MPRLLHRRYLFVYSKCECIVLSDLDEGIRMKGIDRCPKLRVIKMKNCNLQAIEDLGSCECIEKLDLPVSGAVI